MQCNANVACPNFPRTLLFVRRVRVARPPPASPCNLELPRCGTLHIESDSNTRLEYSTVLQSESYPIPSAAAANIQDPVSPREASNHGHSKGCRTRAPLARRGVSLPGAPTRRLHTTRLEHTIRESSHVDTTPNPGAPFAKPFFIHHVYLFRMAQ